MFDSIEALGITHASAWRSALAGLNGICLVCGPTGTGKSTTLKASAAELQRIGQGQLKTADLTAYAGAGFAPAARTLLRSSPDVVLIEIRDAETAAVAVTAAECGLLVIATLPASSITGATRLLQDLGISPPQLAPLLRAVMAQRLMRVFCAACAGAGCPSCEGTRYGGVTVASELMTFANEAEAAAMLGGEMDWTPMVEDAVLQARRGRTSLEEVTRIFGLELVLKQKGIV